VCLPEINDDVDTRSQQAERTRTCLKFVPESKSSRVVGDTSGPVGGGDTMKRHGGVIGGPAS